MKIQIENIPARWDDLNEVLEEALESDSLSELRGRLNKLDVKRSLKFGFGSSHCWVSRKSDNKRVLLITSNI